MFRVLLQSFHKLKLDVSKDDCPFHRVADIVGGNEFLSFISGLAGIIIARY